MNREEFLEILNIQLQGEIPSNQISQHLAYYNYFIQQKVDQGQPEAQVLEELGDPRLIAKTLIDTEDIPNIQGYRQSYSYSAEESNPKASSQNSQGSFQEDDFQKDARQPDSIHRLDLTTWRGKLAVIAAFVLLSVLLALLIGALLPVAGVFLLVAIVVSLINRRR